MHDGPKEETLSLETLLSEALSRNPGLLAFDSERIAARERSTAAGSMPHPTVGFAIRSLPVPSFSFREDEMTSGEVMVRQQFPWFGKRGLRKEARGKDAEIIEAQGEGQALLLAHATADAFADLWLAHRSERIVREQTEAMERLLSLAAQRLAVAGGGQADYLRAEAELERMKEPLLVLEDQGTSARATLTAVMARESLLTGSPEDPPLLPLPEVAPLIASLDHHPELMALSRQKEQAKLEAELARKERWPDPEVGVSYGVRTVHPDMVGLEVMFPIPLFASSKEERLAAASESDAAAVERRWTARRDALVAEIRSSWSAARRERERWTLFEEGILPKLERNVETASAAYQVGAVDFLTILDAQIQIFSLRIETIQARAAYLRSLARLASAAGDADLLLPPLPPGVSK